MRKLAPSVVILWCSHASIGREDDVCRLIGFGWECVPDQHPPSKADVSIGRSTRCTGYDQLFTIGPNTPRPSKLIDIRYYIGSVVILCAGQYQIWTGSIGAGKLIPNQYPMIVGIGDDVLSTTGSDIGLPFEFCFRLRLVGVKFCCPKTMAGSVLVVGRSSHNSTRLLFPSAIIITVPSVAMPFGWLNSRGPPL